LLRNIINLYSLWIINLAFFSFHRLEIVNPNLILICSVVAAAAAALLY
jgi:hypothetical protein